MPHLSPTLRPSLSVITVPLMIPTVRLYRTMAAMVQAKLCSDRPTPRAAPSIPRASMTMTITMMRRTFLTRCVCSGSIAFKNR
jgi:hypothetical protein